MGLILTSNRFWRISRIHLNEQRETGHERAVFHTFTCLTIVEGNSEYHQSPGQDSIDERELIQRRSSTEVFIYVPFYDLTFIKGKFHCTYNPEAFRRKFLEGSTNFLDQLQACWEDLWLTIFLSHMKKLSQSQEDPQTLHSHRFVIKTRKQQQDSLHNLLERNKNLGFKSHLPLLIRS